MNDNNEMDFMDEESEAFEEMLLEYFRENLPKTTMLNMEEFKKINAAVKLLNMFVKEECLEGKVDYELIPEFLSGAVYFEGPLFVVRSMTLFGTLVSISSNIEMYSLTDGNIRICFTFQNVLKSLD